jgi:CCR4-NOT transcription complex subunit 6
LAVSFLLLNNNNNRFSLVYDHLIEFNQLALANAEGSDDMLNRVMTKDNIGLAALLETKEAAWSNGIRPDPSQIHQPLLVCTAHIHWDPQYCDVKLVQTMMLMNEVKNHSFFFALPDG